MYQLTKMKTKRKTALKKKIKGITPESRKVFKDLGLEKYSNLGLIKTKLKGIDTDTIMAINPQMIKGKKMYDIHPLAVIVNKKLMKELVPPK